MPNYLVSPLRLSLPSILLQQVPRASRSGVPPFRFLEFVQVSSLRRLERQEYAFQVPPQDIEPIPSGASQRSVASTSHEDPTLPET